MEQTNTSAWYEKTSLVIILCIIFFPVGLYALWKNSRIAKGWKIGVTALFAIILLASLTDNEENSNQIVNEKANEKANKKTEVKIVFNVPSLLHKNIDEIRNVLGKPIGAEMLEPTKEQMDTNFESWDNNFEKNGCSLLVTFNPQTRKVIDFYITTTTSEKIENIDNLLIIGNLENDSSDYELKTVVAFKNKEINGVTVTPIE
jgi:hypothetical protein